LPRPGAGHLKPTRKQKADKHSNEGQEICLVIDPPPNVALAQRLQQIYVLPVTRKKRAHLVKQYVGTGEKLGPPLKSLGFGNRWAKRGPKAHAGGSSARPALFGRRIDLRSQAARDSQPGPLRSHPIPHGSGEFDGSFVYEGQKPPVQMRAIVENQKRGYGRA